MRMARFIPIAVIVFLGIGVLGGCSIGHETMRGSIVMKFEDRAHVCIGTSDGAQVGDIMFVYRVKVDNTWWLPEYQQRVPTGRTATQRYQKIKVGEVKVTEIFDEHFAAVVLISGELQSNDIVEKRRLR